MEKKVLVPWRVLESKFLFLHSEAVTMKYLAVLNSAAFEVPFRTGLPFLAHNELCCVTVSPLANPRDVRRPTPDPQDLLALPTPDPQDPSALPTTRVPRDPFELPTPGTRRRS
ncbi:hypothetical protein EYF80_024282 [Liparis tanakae]|uniref:Uncharacterized protein n=1 Tax=Liparis tanakae TaxID=230148 RepID=A0A4Z2HKI3_9TELE|nr:hypothetical protein EYF80_024282 [Liparis tanakae]